MTHGTNTNEGGGTVRAINTIQLRYLLSLPKIQVISGLSVDDQGKDDDSEPFEYPCKNPLVLYLNQSPLKLKTLHKIRAATPQLRHIQYEHLSRPERNAPPFDCKKVISALEPVRDELETLKLVDFDWHEEVIDAIPSLSSFTRLTYLEIAPVLLCPTEDPVLQLSDMLPSSLRFLTLSGMRTDLRDVYPTFATNSLLYARVHECVEKKNYLCTGSGGYRNPLGQPKG